MTTNPTPRNCDPCDYLFTSVTLLQEHQINRHVVIVCTVCQEHGENQKFHGLEEFCRHGNCLGLHESYCGHCEFKFKRTLDRDGDHIIPHMKHCQAIVDGVCVGLVFNSRKAWIEHNRVDKLHKRGLRKIRREQKRRQDEQQRIEDERQVERARIAREDKRKEAERLEELRKYEEANPQPVWVSWEQWFIDNPEPKPEEREPEIQARIEVNLLTKEQILRNTYGIKSALEPEEEYVWPEYMLSQAAIAEIKARKRVLEERAARKARRERQAAELKANGEKMG
ncbi:hypothetical protein ABW21_db0200151 [Orbilia brochopaga]|nr:hypothetical protein ABW21_db0200151 [Drechslerella brochopaga]